MKLAKYKKGKFHVHIPYSQNEIMYYMDAGRERCHGSWSKGDRCFHMPFTIDSYTFLTKNNFPMSEQVHNHFKKKMSGITTYNGELQFKTDPYPHQKKAVEMIIGQKKCFLFFDVGVGKTKPAIDSAVNLFLMGKVKKVLVICPAAIMGNWENEVKVHSNMDVTVIDGVFEKRIEKLNNKTLFYIINYEMIHKLFLDGKLRKRKDKVTGNIKEWIEWFPKKDLNFDMVIWDEVHYCKSRSSDRSKFCEKLSDAPSISYKVGLTGTIISNSRSDSFMPFKIVDRSIFGSSYTKFKDRYLIMGGFDAGYGPTQEIGTCNDREFKEKLALCSLRYELDDVADLPPEIEEIVKFDLSPETRKVYNQVRDDWVIEWQGEEKATNNILERLIRLSQISSGFIPELEEFEVVEGSVVEIGNEKLEMLRYQLENIGHHKTIIWCRFRPSIDRVAKLCEEMGLSHYIYDGRTTKKDLYLDYENDDTQIWISQINTGIGYSIPSAKYAIYYEIDHSMERHKQSRGRNRRLKGSEKGSCVYIYLQAKNTLDPHIFKTIKKKDFKAKDALELVKGGKYYDVE